MKKHPHLRSFPRTAALLLAGSLVALLVPRLSAQTTIYYSHLDNSPAAYNTSAPNSPTTLYFDDFSGRATQSGILSGTGAVIIDFGGCDGDGATLTLSAANTHTGATTVNSYSTLALGNVNALQNSTLDMSGGSVTLTVAGTNTYNLPGLTGSGNISIGGNTIRVGANNADTTYSGGLGGSALGVFTKVGAGTLTLSGNNSTVVTTISAGTLALGNVNALLTSTLDTGASGAQAVTFTVAGTNTYRLGGLTGADALAIGGNTIWVGFNLASTTYSGILSGTGGLTKFFSGTLTLTGANLHTGDTTVDLGGTLALGNVNAIANSTLDTGASGAQAVTFTAAGTNTYNVGGLKGADALAIGANTLSVGANGQNTSYAGVLSGSTGALTKTGAGILTLSGANLHSGNTTVHAGTLKLDLSGSISNSAAIIVGDAGSTGTHLDVTTKTGGLTIGLAQTLQGIGQIDGNTTILGTHAPGNSPGLQTFNGNLAYATGAMLNWELAANVSTDTSGVRGTDFDAADVLNTGLFTIATGVTSSLIFNAAGSTVDFTGAFWTSNHSWLAYSDAVAPALSSPAIFDTITVSPDSLAAPLTGGTFAWSQSGYDVVLNYTAAPEPGTMGLLGLGAVLLLRRRRAAVS